MTMLRRKRYYLVDPYSREDLAALFQEFVASDQKKILANLNLYGFNCSFMSDAMRGLLFSEDTIVHVDGMVVLWLCNLFGAKLSTSHCNDHIELIPPIFKECWAKGQKVFMIGSSEHGARDNEDAFKRMFPGLDVNMIRTVGGFTDYFAGRTKMAPRFIGNLGLEWLYRLIDYFSRLAFRYLVEPLIPSYFLVRNAFQGGRWGLDRIFEQ